MISPPFGPFEFFSVVIWHIPPDPHVPLLNVSFMVLARASTTIFGTVAAVGATVVLVEVGTGMSVGRVVEDET